MKKILFLFVILGCIYGEDGIPDALGRLFSPLVCPVVNTVTVAEDTNCGGTNIVTICYDAVDADGDSFIVDFGIRLMGVPIEIETVYDEGPRDLGWVGSGWHCFSWDIGEDLPGVESCDFDVTIYAKNFDTNILTITDSFFIRDAEGVAWDGRYLWVTRSTSITGLDTQRVYKVDPVTHAILDSCVLDSYFNGLLADCEWHDGYLYILHGGLSAQRAKIYRINTETCTIVDSSNVGMWGGSRWGQGIAWLNDTFYTMDSHGQIFRSPDIAPYTLLLPLACP